MKPELIPIRQKFPDDRVDDPAEAVTQHLGELDVPIAPDSRVAIAVGSRGIDSLAVIVRAAVSHVKQRGGVPFVVPAMGSHGGATAEGQREVLRGYGITEQSVGAPIHSSMDVAELPSGDLPIGVFMDRRAWESDGVILINRIKPHTDYHGPYESGLVKMAVIGLGKHRQALDIHRFGVHGLRDLIPQCAKVILESEKILCGIGIVENAHDKACLIEALPGDQVLTREPALLEQARQRMPSLPMEDIDVLVIDRMGKDISGCGVDPNIIGRIRIQGEQEPDSPRIKSIVVTDLTDASHGNALGTGLADVITRRLYEKIDLDVTYENAYTSSFLERAKLPVIAPTAAQALDFALRSCGAIPAGEERIIWIRDTLHLCELYVSAIVLREVSPSPEIETAGEPVAMFDSEGGLVSWRFPG